MKTVLWRAIVLGLIGAFCVDCGGYGGRIISGL